MTKSTENSRRGFLKQLGQSAAVMAITPTALSKAASESRFEYLNLVKKQPIAANDRIRIALIGTGGMGIGDMETALQVPGVEIVSACDLYVGCRISVRVVCGQHLFVTKDYREILERDDGDAAINAATDQWH